MLNQLLTLAVAVVIIVLLNLGRPFHPLDRER